MEIDGAGTGQTTDPEALIARVQQPEEGSSA